MLTKAIF